MQQPWAEDAAPSVCWRTDANSAALSNCHMQAFEEYSAMPQQVGNHRNAEMDAEWSPLNVLNVDGDPLPTLSRPRIFPSVNEIVEPPDNWNHMLDAIKLRLLRCVGEGRPSASNGTNRVTATVLDCVEALSELQSALSRELMHHHQLAQEFVDTQTELADAQAGEREARHLALHDALTTLPNRRYFCERLESALAHSSADRPALAVLYLDLDGFKSVNDLHGHDAGDEVLRIVATRLSRAVRSEDMVSRIGGDEFACLRAGAASRSQLAQLAGKLSDAVSAPMKIAGTLTLSIHVSIGIASYPADGVTPAELLKSADAAMYRAKRLQGRQALFDEVPTEA